MSGGSCADGPACGSAASPGLPSLGLASLGLPSPGLPSPGLPSPGLPSLGLPSLGLPSLGLPSLGLPSPGPALFPSLGSSLAPSPFDASAASCRSSPTPGIRDSAISLRSCTFCASCSSVPASNSGFRMACLTSSAPLSASRPSLRPLFFSAAACSRIALRFSGASSSSADSSCSSSFRASSSISRSRTSAVCCFQRAIWSLIQRA